MADQHTTTDVIKVISVKMNRETRRWHAVCASTANAGIRGEAHHSHRQTAIHKAYDILQHRLRNADWSSVESKKNK